VSIHVQSDVVSRELVNRARAAGLDLYAWTVNEVAEMEKLISWGVKGIVSDYPEKFWKLRLRRN
jgi:glycerophosphoryl diester phosphodiesterase